MKRAANGKVSPRVRRRFRPAPAARGLCLVLAGMLYAGFSQSNNAAFLLGFAVFSMVAVSALHARRNLRDVTAAVDAVPAVFAGHSAPVHIAVENRKKSASFGLGVSCGGSATASIECLPPDHPWKGTVMVTFHRRGRIPLEAVELCSRFPLGFFECSLAAPAGQHVLVYPAPAGRRDYPEHSGARGGGETGKNREGDDFAGLRDYRAGESQRRIDWKSVARGAPLMVKQFEGGLESGLAFDFSDPVQPDAEGKLSQLALWVVRAAETGQSYSLRLPGREFPPGAGKEHMHRCLAALALFGSEEEL